MRAGRYIVALRSNGQPGAFAHDLEPEFQQRQLVAQMQDLQRHPRSGKVRLQALRCQMLIEHVVEPRLHAFVIDDQMRLVFFEIEFFGHGALLCSLQKRHPFTKVPTSPSKALESPSNHKLGSMLNIFSRTTLICTTSTVNLMSPTQQRANFRTNSNHSDADILSEARDLVDQFLLYLKEADIGLDVIDIEDLPFRKPLLINAIRLLIATEVSPLTRQQLRKVGLTLACFQEDIGQRMSMRPVAREKRLPDADVAEIMAQHRHHIQRFDRAFARMTEERRRLDELFQTSLRMAERREAATASATYARAAETGNVHAAHHH